MTEQPAARADSLPMTQLQQQQQQRPLPPIALNDGGNEWRLQPMQQQGNESPRKSPHQQQQQHQQSARERRDDHSNQTKGQPQHNAELAAETRKEEERARNAHKWADKLFFLPEALVIPKVANQGWEELSLRQCTPPAAHCKSSHLCCLCHPPLLCSGHS